MNINELESIRKEALAHLENELLPFWTTRFIDRENGGFITHFDEKGNDTGEDEKSLIAQARCLYTISSAHRAGYGNGTYKSMADHGADFMIEKMWDREHGGFLLDDGQEGKCKDRQKDYLWSELCNVFHERIHAGNRGSEGQNLR
jgi:mannose 2-epimerase